MFDADRWQETWQTINRNKLRTLLTVFGVFWGVFMLVIMLGTGQGLQNGVYDRFGIYATNSIVLWGNRTTLPWQGMAPGRPIRLTQDDLEAIRTQIPEIKYVVPRAQLGGWRQDVVARNGTKTGSFNAMADEPEIIYMQPIIITEGRFINKRDIEEERKMVAIGQQVATTLYESGEEVVGQSIEVNGVNFTVAGIFEARQAGDEADRFANTIFVPFSTFRKAFNYQREVGWLQALSQPGQKASLVEEKMNDLLQVRHRFSPEDKAALGSWNAGKEFEKFESLFSGIRYLIWIVGAGTLLAGAIGLSNIMLIVVKERTREIGVRKALGATPSSIVAMILQETLVLTSVAGYSGLVAAVLLLQFAGSLTGSDPSGESMFKNPEIDFTTAFIALGIINLAGAFAGWIPARTAASVEPVKALRDE